LNQKPGSVPRINDSGTFSQQESARKFQSRFTRSFIYKGGRERSQEEKKLAAAPAQSIFSRTNSEKTARQRPTAMAL
jgi:hypothetical protein